jgi:hypothetical protein
MFTQEDDEIQNSFIIAQAVSKHSKHIARSGNK